MAEKKKKRHYFEYIGVKFLYILTNELHFNTLMSIGNLIGWLLFYVFKIRRKIAFDNITRVFPEKSDKEKNNILLKSYQNFIKSSLEYCLFKKINKFNYYKFGFVENFDTIKNKPHILLGAHFDNPELVSNILKIKGIKLSAFVKKQSNRFVNKFLEDLRTANGIKLIYKNRKSLISVLRLLKKKFSLATVADIDWDVYTGKWIDFFGKKVITPTGPAMLALKTNIDIITVFSIRLPDNTHRIIVQKPLTINKNLGKDELVVDIMSQYNKRLEKIIKKYPEYWFWVHKRWNKGAK